MGVRFIHTADWQIGMPARFMSEEAANRFAEARLEAIRAIGRLARDRDCAFVVVAGDVFDANFLSRRTILRAMEAMADIPVPLYLLPGNHDALEPGTIYQNPDFQSRCTPLMHVLTDPSPLPVLPGVELVAAPWHTKRPDRDLLQDSIAPLEADGTVRIVVGHGAVDDVMGIVRDAPSTIRLEPAERAIAEGRVHYVALGDRHSTTPVGTTGRIWYSGTTEPTRFDEIDPGNVIVVELEGASVRTSIERVGTWHFLEWAVSLGRTEDVEDLATRLRTLPERSRTLVRLTLDGTLPVRAHASLEDLLEAEREALAGLEVRSDTSDLAVRPDNFDFSSLHLAGFAQRALEELTGLAEGGGPEGRTAEGALSLLYRLSAGNGR